MQSVTASSLPPPRACGTSQGDFYEALCKSIDPQEKTLVCCFPDDAGMDSACFQVAYDYLVISVGGWGRSPPAGVKRCLLQRRHWYCTCLWAGEALLEQSLRDHTWSWRFEKELGGGRGAGSVASP